MCSLSKERKEMKRMPSTKVAETRMTMSEIKMKAKALGLKPGKMKKVDLIHAIQVAEGCEPCFGHTDGSCSHTDCCFLKDCLKTRL